MIQQFLSPKKKQQSLIARKPSEVPSWIGIGSVWPRCRSSGRHNFLIRISNWTFYICISIVSTRSTQWYSPICNLTNLSRPVWPVHVRGLTGLSRLPRKPSSCQIWVSTAAQFRQSQCPHQCPTLQWDSFPSIRFHWFLLFWQWMPNTSNHKTRNNTSPIGQQLGEKK